MYVHKWTHSFIVYLETNVETWKIKSIVKLHILGSILDDFSFLVLEYLKIKINFEFQFIFCF